MARLVRAATAGTPPTSGGEGCQPVDKVGVVSMAREDKLKPVRTKEEASERGRKGGIASGIARREKKTFRATLELLLDRKLDGSPLTGREAVAFALFEKAMSGDVKAFQELRDTVGEKPVDKQELSGSLDVVSVIEEARRRANGC